MAHPIFLTLKGKTAEAAAAASAIDWSMTAPKAEHHRSAVAWETRIIIELFLQGELNSRVTPPATPSPTSLVRQAIARGVHFISEFGVLSPAGVPGGGQDEAESQAEAPKK